MPFTLTGAQVRRLRLLAKVTQAELARELRCSRRTVIRWERASDTLIPAMRWLPVLNFLVPRRQLLRELGAEATLDRMDNPAKSGVRRRLGSQS